MISPRLFNNSTRKQFKLMKRIVSILFMSVALTVAAQTSHTNAVVSTMTPEQEKAFNKDWANYDRYGVKNESLTKRPDVVFMGNSITDSWAKMRPEFFENNNIAGRGISGQVTSQMLCRFHSDVISLHPKAVVILGGINDIAHNNGKISNRHIFENIQSMCDLAKANGIKPILCSILPAYQIPWMEFIYPGDNVREINNMLKYYAKKNKIDYVDYYSALADEKGSLPSSLSKDGIHPNAQGYKIMEDVVYPHIKKYISNKRK